MAADDDGALLYLAAVMDNRADHISEMLTSILVIGKRSAVARVDRLPQSTAGGYW